MSGNLKPFKAGEPRAVACGRKGGIASGISRRATLAELLKAELDREDESGGIFGNEKTGLSRRAAMIRGLVDRAVRGDAKAIMLVLQLEEMAGTVNEA